MSLAKVISLTGSFVYLTIFISSLIFPEKIKDSFLQGVRFNSKTFLAIIIAATFLLSVVNFSYFYFLHISSENGEKMESAVFLSLQLLIMPLVILAVCFVLIGF